jgi:hypothetical protein
MQRNKGITLGNTNSVVTQIEFTDFEFLTTYSNSSDTSLGSLVASG